LVVSDDAIGVFCVRAVANAILAHKPAVDAEEEVPDGTAPSSP
jgi:hypothetical protein